MEVRSFPLRPFNAFTEAVVLLTYIGMTASFLHFGADLRACLLIILTIVICAVVHVSPLVERGPETEWGMYGAALLVTSTTDFALNGFTVYTVALPFAGLMYVYRIFRISTANRPVKTAVSAFANETLLLPLLLYAVSFGQHTSPVLAVFPLAQPLSLLLYAFVRVASLTALQRYTSSLRLGVDAAVAPLRPVMIFLIGLTMALLFIPAATYIATFWISVGFGYVGSVLLGAVFQAADVHHVSNDIAYIVAFIVTILVALLASRFTLSRDGLKRFFKFPKRGDKYREKMRIQERRDGAVMIREGLPPRRLVLGSTVSAVRRRYQSMLRQLEKEGLAAAHAETPREYVGRLERMFTESRHTVWLEGARNLCQAYEAVRYGQEERERGEWVALADRGLHQFRSARRR